jgi:GntR family transcriptional regulator, transcriptional repressor for pyruvate dehydrogenase complex
MFSPVKPTKIYEQVIEQIKDFIKKGELKYGDKLPAERDLCERLKVSRTSIREALRALEILGLIECRQGEGNFIKDNFENSLLESLSMMFMLHGSNPTEVLEFRKIIEPGTAALAARKINVKQLSEIKEVVSLLNNTDDEGKSVEFDKKFHYLITQASGNYIISNMMSAVSSLVDKYIESARMNMFHIEGNKTILNGHHDDIVAAIEARDPAAAAAAMRKHLDYTTDYMLRLE